MQIEIIAIEQYDEKNDAWFRYNITSDKETLENAMQEIVNDKFVLNKDGTKQFFKEIKEYYEVKKQYQEYDFFKVADVLKTNSTTKKYFLYIELLNDAIKKDYIETSQKKIITENQFFNQVVWLPIKG